MKKYIAIVLLFGALFSCCSCGKTAMSNGNKESAQTPEVTPDTTEPSEEKEEIKIEAVPYAGAYGMNSSACDPFFEDHKGNVAVMTTKEQLPPHIQYSEEFKNYIADQYKDAWDWVYFPENLIMARDLYRFMVWCSGEPFFDYNNILIIKIPYHDVCCEHVVSSVNLVTEGNETRLQVELSWKVYSHFHSPAMPKKNYLYYYVAVPNDLGIDYVSDIEIITNEIDMYALKGMAGY